MKRKTVTRTTHRSKTGTKLYAVRKRGKFADVQTHKRSSRADQRRTTVAEAERWLVRAAVAFSTRATSGSIYGQELTRLHKAVDRLLAARKAERRKPK
jgi:hypothetical protein